MVTGLSKNERAERWYNYAMEQISKVERKYMEAENAIIDQDQSVAFPTVDSEYKDEMVRLATRKWREQNAAVTRTLTNMIYILDCFKTGKIPVHVGMAVLNTAKPLCEMDSWFAYSLYFLEESDWVGISPKTLLPPSPQETPKYLLPLQQLQETSPSQQQHSTQPRYIRTYVYEPELNQLIVYAALLVLLWLITLFVLFFKLVLKF